MPDQEPGALAGTLVLDLSENVAGPFATKMLADYGAGVIKVERPGEGDPNRRYGPFAREDDPLETGALHLYLDTNKQSVTLDWNTASGAELLRRLAAYADLLVTDSHPATLDAAGLSWDALHALNPRLAVLSLSAFGDTGPYANWAATNLTTLATGGQMAISGDTDREPLKSGGFQADYQLGLNGFVAGVIAIFDALRGGEGQHVELSAMEVMASTLELMLNTYSYTHQDFWGGRRGNVMSSVIGVYPAADGYLGIHAMPRNFRALLEVMEMPELADDPRFNSMQARLENEDELRAIMYAWTSQQNKKEAYERAGKMRGPIAYVHDMEDLVQSPQLQARHYLREIDHPVAGRLRYPRGPFILSETPWREGRAPLLGEHTREVLQGRLGLSDEDLAVLRGNGVI